MDFAVVYFLAFLVHLTVGFQTGAPRNACVTMTPVHPGYFPQVVPSTHVVTASATSYQAGTPIQVMISGQFQGVLLQARRVGGTTQPIGSFIAPPPNTKLMSCTSASDSVTHSNPNPKTSFSVTWNPPLQAVGDIEFVATVADAMPVFWINQKSAVLSPFGVQTSTDSDSGTHLDSASTDSDSGTHLDNGSSSVRETMTAISVCTSILVFSMLKKFM